MNDRGILLFTYKSHLNAGFCIKIGLILFWLLYGLRTFPLLTDLTYQYLGSFGLYAFGFSVLLASSLLVYHVFLLITTVLVYQKGLAIMIGKSGSLWIRYSEIQNIRKFGPIIWIETKRYSFPLPISENHRKIFSFLKERIRK